MGLLSQIYMRVHTLYPKRAYTHKKRHIYIYIYMKRGEGAGRHTYIRSGWGTLSEFEAFSCHLTRFIDILVLDFYYYYYYYYFVQTICLQQKDFPLPPNLRCLISLLPNSLSKATILHLPSTTTTYSLTKVRKPRFILLLPHQNILGPVMTRVGRPAFFRHSCAALIKAISDPETALLKIIKASLGSSKQEKIKRSWM